MTTAGRSSDLKKCIGSQLAYSTLRGSSTTSHHSWRLVFPSMICVLVALEATSTPFSQSWDALDQPDSPRNNWSVWNRARQSG